jgi:serine/threonine protein kinase
VAIKEMNLARQPRKDMIINEIRIMKETVHPNIVNFIDSFLVRDSLWVIMEYMEGGMLTDIIDKETFTEPQISIICLEVLGSNCRLSKGFTISTKKVSSTATLKATMFFSMERAE